jgi:hypothetical protein
MSAARLHLPSECPESCHGDREQLLAEGDDFAPRVEHNAAEKAVTGMLLKDAQAPDVRFPDGSAGAGANFSGLAGPQ